MEINTFGVIGAGQMGNGIAQVAATAGLNVIMSDIEIEFAEKGWPTSPILGKNVDKGKISRRG
jgi:3-hydroxybutyryl-CoA dehydrogenase